MDWCLLPPGEQTHQNFGEEEIKADLAKFKGWMCWKEGMEGWVKFEKVFMSEEEKLRKKEKKK